MSAAGDFVLTCRRRGVLITLAGDQVSLRGCKPDIERLVPLLERCVDDVHALLTRFVYAVPPRPAERH